MIQRSSCTFVVGLLALCLAASVSAQTPAAAAADSSAQEGEHFAEFDHEITWPKLPEPVVGAPDARLSIYFDLVSRTRSRAVAVNEPFEFFLVAQNTHLPVLAWECKLTVDAPLRIIEEDVGGINVGTGGEYRVARKPMDCLAGSTVVLARFKAILLESDRQDLVFRLGPVTQSTNRDPDRPGYVLCREALDVRAFQYEATAAVVNPVQVRLPDEQPASDRFKPARGRDG